jgi:hypothetical protein
LLTATHPFGGWDGAPTAITLKADDAGMIEYGFSIPQIADTARMSVAAEDQSLAAAGAPLAQRAAAVTMTVTSYDVLFPDWTVARPVRGLPGHRGRLSVRGFIGTYTRTVYVHYLLRGHVVRTLPVGRLRGACGTLTVPSFAQFAFRPVPAGVYRIVFDTWPAYFEFAAESISFTGIEVRPQDAVR